MRATRAKGEEERTEERNESRKRCCEDRTRRGELEGGGSQRMKGEDEKTERGKEHTSTVLQ
jgi:hypothetical protein